MFVALLDETFLLNEAKKLGTSFQELGKALGLSSAEVDQIIHDKRDAVTINFYILLTWNCSRPQESRSVLLDKLRDALSEIGRGELVAAGKLLPLICSVLIHNDNVLGHVGQNLHQAFTYLCSVHN